MVAVPSAELRSTVKPPSTNAFKVAVIVAVPSASFTVTSAMVTDVLSSLLIVTVAVSVDVTASDVDCKLSMETVTVSLVSTLVSSVGSSVKV